MAKKTIRTTVSITQLQRHFSMLRDDTRAKLDVAMTKLTSEAEQTAVDLINRQIYDTPPRGRYVRTGALRGSIDSVQVQKARDKWEVLIGAVGQLRGRKYASFNELGTYKGRVSRRSIQKRAKAIEGLIQLHFGRPSKGLEPRPWTIPTAVMIGRRMPEVFIRAVRMSERDVQRTLKKSA